MPTAMARVSFSRSSLCRLKHSLTTWGEKFTEKEWESMVSEAPMAGSGKIDIKKWAKIITGGGDDE